jgi:hypothetical protein
MSQLAAKRPMRVVVRREVLNAPPPKLVDYHMASEAVTEELPEAYGYESLWETVEHDLGGFRKRREDERQSTPRRMGDGFTTSR